jgi:hypothetical protein
VIKVEPCGEQVKINKIIADSDSLYIRSTVGVNPFSESEDKHECALVGIVFKAHPGVKLVSSYEECDTYKIYKRCGRCLPLGVYNGVDYGDDYLVSENGDVFTNKKTGFYAKSTLTPLIPDTTKKGYRRVNLCKDNKLCHASVHRLVPTVFLENPDPTIYTEVNHKDLITHHNWLNNLEWCKPSYNRKYSEVFHRFERAAHTLAAEEYIPHCQRITKAIDEGELEDTDMNAQVLVAIADIVEQRKQTSAAG